MNILNRIATRITYIRDNYRQMKSVPRRLEDIQTAIGRIELYLRLSDQSNNLQRHEFKVFSQNGDDGIIQYLINRVTIARRFFVEFGVEDYSEANTRFLLENDNWCGLVIDGSKQNIERLKRDRIFGRHNLKVECAFVDAENINGILVNNGVEGDIGLLSIDIDGNDYWVWKAIEVVQPRIVVCEYNSTFGPSRKLTVPYDPHFVRGQAHYSNLYYGASIAALNHLARAKGYSLVGSNNAGNNAFFVRNDLLSSLPVFSAEQAYVIAQFRESRDIHGNSTYLNLDERLAEISEMPVYDLDRDCLTTLGAVEPK